MPSRDEVASRPLALATPMALCGLAVASFTVGSYQIGWIATREGHQVALGVLVVIVPLQALSAAVSLIKGDTAMATASGMLAVALGLALEQSRGRTVLPL